LAVLAIILMPSLAERGERMNAAPGKRRFLNHMLQKRVEPFNPQPDPPVIT